MTRASRFNGAALVGVRRAPRPCEVVTGKPSFNGAALVGVRRVDSLSALGLPGHLLQRGRTRGSAESGFGGGRGGVPDLASTGPHSWECGEMPAVGRLIDRDRHASTGPHSWECGELTAQLASGTVMRASTGPHSWECGESVDHTPISSRCSLQRGRTRGSAERGQGLAALLAHA